MQKTTCKNSMLKKHDFVLSEVYGSPYEVCCDRAWFATVIPVPSLERHIFVCVNERESTSAKGCCFSKGGKAVRDAFKKELALRKLTTLVRANKSGCLDQCEAGVVLVIYPEQVWYQGVSPQDVNEIIESHILDGRYVTRLLMPGQKHLDQQAAAKALSVVS